MKRYFLAAAISCAFFLTPEESAAQSCPEIRFERGAYSGEVSGRVTDRQPLCFTFGAGSGQTARLQVFGGDNTCFTIAGVTDCREDFTFRTRRQTYRVDVFQLIRMPRWEQFTLRLSIR